jgi:amino acid adenylation domain-containing protein
LCPLSFSCTSRFYTLLYRYTAQEDLIIGTPITTRHHKETKSLIGCFINTLALRTNLWGNPNFSELLGRVRLTTLEAYRHQDYPFTRLVEVINPERGVRQNPLFQVMMAYQASPFISIELQELKITSFELPIQTSEFDLILDVHERGSEIAIKWQYQTDLFDTSTITRMMGHFQILLKGIIANPEQPICQLPLLTEAERHQLLVEWNNTEADYPKDKCIHQLFEEQVEWTPDNVAVVFEDQELTYRELNVRANQLAYYLQKLGIKPEVLVGICLERSPLILVGLLGILKAGGAYVPLDPDYPAERLAFILEDTQVPVLLTQQSLVEKLPANQAQSVCLETDWDKINCQDENNLTCTVTADNLAYVMYTSGSTGKPKGVAVPHQAVTRLLFNTNYIQLEPDDIIAQVSNTSFDAATFEIWGTLLHGGKLVLIPKDVLLSPQDFAAHLHQQEISVLFLTTALFNQLASTVPQAFKNLRYLLFGGEAVDPRWVKEILEKAPPQRLLHVYGPTESTTFSSSHLVQEVPEGGKTIPIGRPISNTQIYILDRHLQPVPIGVAGELYIGGDGLAKGYLNRPELTEEKFIPLLLYSLSRGAREDESSHQERLYKTGDLARYLPDGNIEFLGRIDQQVKIRGFRIELGEIETVLLQHPSVEQTVVIDREDTPGEKRLVAYLVPSDQSSIQNPKSKIQNQLRDFLKQKLPDYMIPSVFVLLETLPLTPNGKIDRRALLAPDQTRLEQEGTFVAPRDELERQMTQIWEKVLGIKAIGVKDNFFDLGGHSLLAVQLFAQIEKTLQTNLPLSAFFQSPTVEQLANSIRSQEWSSHWRSLVRFQLNGSKPPLFLIHACNGEVSIYRVLAQHLGLERPIYGLQAIGLDGKQAPYNRVEEIAAHYIKEIQTVQPEGPYFLGGKQIGGWVAYEMAQQLVSQGHQVELVVFFGGVSNRKPLVRFNRQWTSRQIKQLLLLGPSYVLKRVKEISQMKVTKEGTVSLSIKQALANYRPQIYHGRVAIFQPIDSYNCEGPELDREHHICLDVRRILCSKTFAGGFEIHYIPGSSEGDYTAYKEPNVRIFAEKLRVYLEGNHASW